MSIQIDKSKDKNNFLELETWISSLVVMEEIYMRWLNTNTFTNQQEDNQGKHLYPLIDDNFYHLTSLNFVLPIPTPSRM